MSISQITAEQVRAYREAHGCGLLDAKSALLKERRFDILNLARAKLDTLRQSTGGVTKEFAAITDILDLMLEASA